MKDIVVLILAAVAGALGVIKALYDYRQTRVTPLPRESTLDTRLLTLETEREKDLTASDWRILKALNWILLAIGIIAILVALGWFIYFTDEDTIAFDIAFLILYILGFGVLAQRVFYLSLSWGKTAGEPVHSSSASLIVKGNLPLLVTQCQGALRAMNAIRDNGTQIVAHSSKYAKLEAATGSRPTNVRGQRITIDIQRCRQDIYSIVVTSAAYSPSLFIKKKNSANVVRLLHQFL